MKRINDMMNWFEAKISECEEKRNQLISDERADEANFEKIRANIYDVFRTVLNAAQKACGEDLDGVKDFFLKRLEQIPESWHTSYEKAQEYNDTEKLQIESIKLEAAEDIKNEFLKIWEGEK